MDQFSPHIEQVDLASLVPYPNNPKLHPQDQIDLIAGSIQEFGFLVPLVIDAQNQIVAGHGRYIAATKLNLATVPAIRVEHLTKAQIKAFRLADNKVAESEWDAPALALELEELADLGFNLSIAGFDEPKPVVIEEDEPPIDAADELQAKWQVKTGDLWRIGEHRLLCGDATKREDVERLMGGEKAQMVFTDPPYGVAYNGGATTPRTPLVGDETTDLYGPCCAAAMDFSDDRAPLYLWHAGVKGIAAAAAAAAAGYEIRCELVWNKNQAQFGALSAQYKQKHEPAYYCFKRGTPPRWYGPTNEVTVWDVARASVNEWHPTQKPTELAARAMLNSTEADDLIGDWFLGSGSTMVAAHQLGRRCYGMEIEPKYCAVVLERMSALGLEPKLLEA